MTDKPQEDRDLIDQIGEVVDTATESITQLFSGISLPKPRKVTLGAAPGLDDQAMDKMAAAADEAPVTVTVYDYCADWVNRHTVDNMDDYLATHRPEGTKVRWVTVDGLSDPGTIRQLANKYCLHPLALEDVFNVPQRAKVEAYPAEKDYFPGLFIVAHMMQLVGEGSQVRAEQVSIFLGKDTVLTFLEDPGDVFDPVRQRVELDVSRIRQHDGSCLVYAMLDAIVDNSFPILERYSERLEDIEAQVMAGAKPQVVNDIYRVKWDLLLLSRQLWPLREAVSALMREEHEWMAESTQVYMRDVYDHIIQLMEMIEAYRELAGGLADTHLTVMGNRMNEVMKVLTIFATIFIPITFVAGVYGMNFDVIPELKWQYSYAVFWVIGISIAGGMLFWFRRKGWL